MKAPIFTGSAVALITPFTHGEIDTSRLKLLIERQLLAGTSAIVMAGTTGESAVLSEKERTALIASAAEIVRGRVPVIAGAGSNDTKKALRLCANAAAAGADAVLCVTPYYNKTTQRGLVEYYYTLADRSALPVIAYNVPSRTGLNLEPATAKKLSEHGNIAGLKDASGNIEQTLATLAAVPEDFTLWCGSDQQTAAQMALGAKGCISAAANVLPKEIARLCRLALNGDFLRAAALQRELVPALEVLYTHVNPVDMKAALELMQLDSGELRPPLTALTESEKELLNRRLHSALRMTKKQEKEK